MQVEVPAVPRALAAGFTRFIRAFAPRHPAQVIVLFSAHLDRETQDAAEAVGVTACVSKTEIRRLASILRDLMPTA